MKYSVFMIMELDAAGRVLSITQILTEVMACRNHIPKRGQVFLAVDEVHSVLAGRNRHLEEMALGENEEQASLLLDGNGFTKLFGEEFMVRVALGDDDFSESFGVHKLFLEDLAHEVVDLLGDVFDHVDPLWRVSFNEFEVSQEFSHRRDLPGLLGVDRHVDVWL